MLNDFVKILQSNFNISNDQSILLAVSGGRDSMVMLDLFSKTSFKIAVAHVNFGLRGQESNKDEEFVLKACDRFGINCFVHHADMAFEITKAGVSTQIAARNIRYSYFKQIMAEYQYDYMATAHHAQDNLETIIYNFVKGPTVKGFGGIPIQNGNIIRPLLSFLPEDLDDYIKIENIKWREDSSNAKLDYSRNKIRHNILPEIKEINSGVISTFQSKSHYWQRLQEYLEIGVKNLIIEYKKGDFIKIPTEDLENNERLFLIGEVLRRYDFNDSQIENTLNLRDAQSGKQVQNEKFLLVKDRSQLIISPIAQSHVEYQIDHTEDQIRFSEGDLKISKYNMPKSWNSKLNEAFIDLDLIKFPLILRKIKEGDRFQPLGMKGKKKVSDFMIDQKIPVNLKLRQYVLTSENTIVWLLGQRMDERFKITEKTKRVMHLQLNYHEKSI